MLQRCFYAAGLYVFPIHVYTCISKIHVYMYVNYSLVKLCKTFAIFSTTHLAYIYTLSTVPWTKRMALSLFSCSESPLSLTHWILAVLVSSFPITYRVYTLTCPTVSLFVLRASCTDLGRSLILFPFSVQYTGASCDTPVIHEKVAVSPKKTVASFGLVSKTKVKI